MLRRRFVRRRFVCASKSLDEDEMEFIDVYKKVSVENFFCEPAVHFSKFSPLMPLTEVSPKPSAIQTDEWQSAVGWGATGFEPETAGQQSGAQYLFIQTAKGNNIGTTSTQSKRGPSQQNRNEKHTRRQRAGCQSGRSYTCPYMVKIYTRRIYKGRGCSITNSTYTTLSNQANQRQKIDLAVPQAAAASTRA